VGRRFEIVGMVGSVRTYSMTSNVKPEVYLPYRQTFFTGAELGPILVVRTTHDPREAIDLMRSTVEGESPPGPILKDLKLAKQVLAASASSERFQTILLGVFAALALVLAVIGVYGVISYTTSQRVHEIGIRMALGAKRRDVLRLIVGSGVLLALCGVVIGAALSLVLSRFMSSVLYGVVAADAITIVGLALCLTIVAGLACLLPARRAMNVDPMVALRHE
jgi:putative ABC transport system permease protein